MKTLSVMGNLSYNRRITLFNNLSSGLLVRKTGILINDTLLHHIPILAYFSHWSQSMAQSSLHHTEGGI